MTKLEELKAKHAELQKQILEESKAMFHEATKELFAAHPRLQSFSWTQYTPHFNDGDECVFSANTDTLTIKIDGIPEDESGGIGEFGLDSEYFTNYYPTLSVDPEALKAAKAVIEALAPLDSQSLKEMFGDHCKVIVSRSGVDTEGYDHD